MEIEAKLKVDSHDGVRARLKAVGATFVGRVLETLTLQQAAGLRPIGDRLA